VTNLSVRELYPWKMSFTFWFYFLPSAPVACFGFVVTLSRFLAIWVTLAAVWKIIWHLYSRLIGIFYETRACRKVQQSHSAYKPTNKQTFVLLSTPWLPSFTGSKSMFPLFWQWHWHWHSKSKGKNQFNEQNMQ